MSPIALLCLLAIFPAAQAAESTAKALDSGAGVWINRASAGIPSLQVKLDPGHRNVDVSLSNPAHGTLPRSIEILLFDSEGRRTFIELKAMDPVNFPDQYHGSLSSPPRAAAQSFTGFEIRIPFESQAATVIHSEDLRKVEP